MDSVKDAVVFKPAGMVREAVVAPWRDVIEQTASWQRVWWPVQDRVYSQLEDDLRREAQG